MISWSTTTLGNLIELQRGHDLPERDRRPGSVPVIGSAGQNGWHDTSKAPAPGVTIGRSGASAGVVTFVKEPYWPHNTVLYVKSFKGNDPRFLAYLLETLPLAELNSGAAQPSLNRNFLYPTKVRVPAPEHQRRISSILGAYDDLLELNQRRIVLLEKIARELFDEWFVHFRFPGHELEERRSTGHGEVPASWVPTTLGEVCITMHAGATPPRRTTEFWTPGAIDWYTTGELQDCFLLGSEERISQAALDAKKGRLFPSGTIFMAIYGSPTVGRVGISVEPCSTNQAALAMRPDTRVVGPWFLVHTLWCLRRHFNAIAHGAAQQNISKEKVRDTEFLLPPKPVVDEFERLATPLWDLRRTLEIQQRKLSVSRDLLLPRLISGDVSIAAAERELGAAA